MIAATLPTVRMPLMTPALRTLVWMLMCDDDRLTINTADGTVVERLGTRPSYTYQLEAFAAHVQHGAELPLDTADAVQNMAYVDAAYRAAGMMPR